MANTVIFGANTMVLRQIFLWQVQWYLKFSGILRKYNIILGKYSGIRRQYSGIGGGGANTVIIP